MTLPWIEGVQFLGSVQLNMGHCVMKSNFDCFVLVVWHGVTGGGEKMKRREEKRQRTTA